MRSYRADSCRVFLDNMWEINITDQIITFGLSLCLGALLCVFYDIIRALRKAGFNSFTAVFFTDIIFWLFSAFVTFIFLIVRTNGEIRGYVLLSELLGFILFRISLSKLLFKMLSFIFVWVTKIKDIIYTKTYLCFDRIEAITLKIFCKGFIFFKRALKSAKKLLKKVLCLLYTNKNNENTENVLNETKTET